MDPFAAIGLAGNIIQFVDFACNLFSKANEISNSASGASEEVEDAATIAASIRELSSHLLLSPEHPKQPSAAISGDLTSQRPSKLDGHLTKLAGKCQDAAMELLVALESLQAQDPKSKWSSFSAALRVVWKERRVKRMQQRLKEYREQIVAVLVLLQRDDKSGFHAKFDSLREANREEYADLSSQIAESQSSMLKGIEQLKLDLSHQHLDLPGERHQGNEGIDVVAAKLVKQAQAGTDIGIALSILRSLRFMTMRNRYHKVARAHEQTLQWMFDNTFSQWLTSNHPIFWISGKPGSGKSTCMKYLVDNSQTERYLRLWAGERQVVIAHYFFWVNGTEFERSQEGLLQSILYEILRQEPDLIKSVCAQRWGELEQGVPEREMAPWNLEELIGSLGLVFQVQTSAKKFCIFIDGLDEYSGRHEDLVGVIQGLISSKNVKICIASRPWNVFESAFGADQMHKLYLEQLNRPDIRAYVKSKLESRDDFQLARKRGPEMDGISEEVVARSQGVFLWDFVVVRSLGDGLQNRDSLTHLYSRLRSFPSDLNDFFRHMLLSVDDPYHVQTAHVFQIALAARRPLPFLQYWYANIEESDTHFWKHVPITSLSDLELKEYEEDVRIRLSSRTKGLLEVTLHSDDEITVDFLHRTVKDYLQTTEVQRMLNDWSFKTSELEIIKQSAGLNSREAFDPYRTICKVSIAAMRVQFRVFATVNTIYMALPKRNQELVLDFFNSLRAYEFKTGQTLGELVQLFEKTLLEAEGSEDKHIRNHADFIAMAEACDTHIWLRENQPSLQHVGLKKRIMGSLRLLPKSKSTLGSRRQLIRAD